VLLLDKIQKGENITDEGAKLLKKKNLIEGRKGRYYISAEIAAISNQKTDYTRNKGLNKKFYKEMILQHIQNYEHVSREEIDKLLWDKLPDSMNEKQKKIKINNILTEMSGKLIQNVGSRTKPKWILLNEKSGNSGFNNINTIN
jgi:ATP-dependent DNA helicase RecG